MRIKRFNLGLWPLCLAAAIFPAVPALALPSAEGLAITSPSSPLPLATEGVAYAPVTFAAVGGTGSYTWSQTGLPDSTGLTLTSAGVLSGMPVKGSQGLYTLTVTVADPSGNTAAGQFQLTINAALPSITGPSSPLPSATTGIAYAPVTFTATGGTGGYKWQQTGLPASTGLSLTSAGALGGTPASGSQGLYTFTVTLTDSSGNTATGQFQISIINPLIFASPQWLSFSYLAGSNVPIPSETFSVFSRGAALKYSVSSSEPWLNAVVNAGQTPDNVTLTIQNLSGLPQCPGPAACSHTAIVTVALPGNVAGGQVGVTVDLTVIPLQPVLSVSSQYVTVSSVAGGAGTQRRLQVLNTGGQTLNYTVTAPSVSWLSVSCGASGAVTFSTPTSICLSFNPGNLDAGVYHAPVTIVADNGIHPVTVNVTLRVAAAGPLILMWPGAMEFTALFGAQSPPGQSLNVYNFGSGTLNWTAQATGAWLQLSATACGSPSQTVTGTAASGGAGGSLVVCVNSSRASLGANYGQIVVTSPDGTAGNSAAMTVLLNVLPGGIALPEIVSPTALTLQSTAGSSTLASATVNLTNPNVGAVNLSLITVTQDGSGWLTTQQNSGYIPGATTTSLQVRASAATLAAGTYHGQVRIAFADGTNTVVNVVLAVSPAPGQAAFRRPRTSPPNCPGGAVLPPQFVNLTQQGFVVQAGTVQQLLVQVKDSCGNPITEGEAGSSVGVVIYNAGTLAILDAPDLVYNAALSAWQFGWTPSSAAVGPVGLSAVAALGVGDNTLGNRSDIWSGTVAGGLPGEAAEPLVTINAADPNVDGVFQANQVAAGSYIAIYGDLFADGIDKPYPFPTLDQGSTVLLGGVPLLLEYVSPTQINALVPTTAGLPLNAPLPLKIQRDGTQSLVDTQVSVTDVQPAIFILDQYSQGAVLIANTTSVAAPVGYLPGSRAAVAGVDYIEIYCNGLGPVHNPPVDGQPAGANPVPMTVTQPTVTVGGVNAPVVFSGLSPGSIALYQVNVQVPAGSLKGNGVQVVVQMGDVASNTVLISVR